tara:strand:- start:650 stop:2017 length:1368 start_codon:yes stop_codon:yes gene_type:complete
MAEQPQLVPKDFTTDEYNKLKDAWAASPKGQAVIKKGSEQDAWYYENETWRYVFEADVYGNLPNQKGNFQTSFEMAEWGSAAPHIFLDQFKGATELQELITEDESGLSSVIEKNNLIKVKSSLIPPATVNTSSTNSLRYPTNQGGITNDHDYVTFQFYKYTPPFRKRKPIRSGGQTESYTKRRGTAFKKEIVVDQYDYNQAAGKGEQSQYTNSNGMAPIVLYMPEDISTGFRSNWTGKAYGNFASDALKAAGAEGIGQKLKGAATAASSAIDRSIPIQGAMAMRKVLQKIGGDQLSNDDLFGGISGAILNPNVELMYGGTDLRNFTLNFKLVPRDATESSTIKQICNQFKRAMLPKLDPGDVFGGTSPGTFKGFIGVPDLCRVAFMKGSSEHEGLPRFKMCAITQVDVNYTPDGAYATYFDGQPVAIQLSISFQETKMVFAEEIGGVNNGSEGIR